MRYSGNVAWAVASPLREQFLHRGHKNLLIIHLESVSWQTLNAFPESFPNLLRIMPNTRRFRSYFSSATSTQMAMTSLLHANGFELDRLISK